MHLPGERMTAHESYKNFMCSSILEMLQLWATCQNNLPSTWLTPLLFLERSYARTWRVLIYSTWRTQLFMGIWVGKNSGFL